MASADSSQLVVTTANETACEASRDKPASLSSSTCLIYAHGLRLPFGLRCLWPAYPPCTPYIRFLFVRLRFRYPFLSPTPRGVNLGSRFGVRRQLRPLWTFTTDRRHARRTEKSDRQDGSLIFVYTHFFSIRKKYGDAGEFTISNFEQQIVLLSRDERYSRTAVPSLVPSSWPG